MAEEEINLPKTDEELVISARKNNENYRYLMQRYTEKLIRYIVRVTGSSREDAEDILQGVFIKAYRNLNNFDTSLKFSSWIYRIAHNEAVSYLRKRSARPKTINPEASEILVGLIKTDFDIQEAIDKKKLEERIRETIQKLDQKYRDVLILKYIEGKDYREISDILKRPQGTVATLLRRAKERLRDEILKQKSFSNFYLGRKIKNLWTFRRKH